MKKLRYFFLFVFLSLVSFSSFATDYYFSNTGSDNNTGTSAESPFRTINKANSIKLYQGDKLLFKRGDIFRGELLIHASGTLENPIMISSYGSGEIPVISGSEYINGWTSAGNGIYRAYCPVNPKMVFYNGQPLILARYPNIGFLFADSPNGQNGFSDNDLPNNGNLYVGAGLHMRTARYRYEERLVSVQSGRYLGFDKPTVNSIIKGAGYYLTGKLEFLDTAGEFYYDSENQQLYLKPIDGKVPQVNSIEASRYDNGIKLESSPGIIIREVRIVHQQKNGIYAYGAPTDYLTITDCVFQNIFLYGITGSNKRNVTISQNKFMDIWDGGVFLGGVPNLTITNNLFKRIGIAAPGQATDNLISYKCIDMNGSDGIISNNILDSIGNGGIQFFQKTLVEKNIITRYCMPLDDGAGIGAWGTDKGIRNGTGCYIRNNIVSDPVGNNEGFPPASEPFVNGIGMDDNSGNAVFENNTIYNVKGRGISIHNSSYNQIRNNTIFNCSNGALVLEHDYSGGMLSGNLITGNIMYNVKPDEYSLKVVNWNQTETGINFATFSGNYYSNPYNDAPIYTAYFGKDIRGVFGLLQSDYSVRGWKEIRDSQAKASPLKLHDYKVISIAGNDLVYNGTFDANMDGWGCYAEGNTCGSQWQNNSLLDGGSVKVTSAQYDYGNFYNTRLVSLQKGKQYLLKYSVIGTENKIASFNIQDRNNWAQLTPKVKTEVASVRINHELLLTPDSGSTAGRLTFYIGPQLITSYSIDNISLKEVTTQYLDPFSQNKIFINKTANPQSVSLKGVYLDLDSNVASGGFVLEPFSSRVLVAIDETALPLTFLKLEGVGLDKSSSSISWKIASGNNPDCVMELQKSLDGDNFKSIYNVKSEPGQVYYQFTDKKFFETSYYRLKTTCNGEGETFSRVIMVKNENHGVSVFPNPITGRNLNIMNDANFYKVVIFGIDGTRQFHASLNNGLNIISLPVMKKGSYILQLQGDHATKIVKLIKN